MRVNRNHYFLACNGCNGIKSDKWPAAGEYVRPDQGQPAVLFVFDEHGGMQAQQEGSDAQRTVNDFGLDRPGLRDARKVAIGLQWAMMRDLINEHLLPDRKSRLAQGLVKRAEDPAVSYSQALG